MGSRTLRRGPPLDRSARPRSSVKIIIHYPHPRDLVWHRLALFNVLGPHNVFEEYNIYIYTVILRFQAWILYYDTYLDTSLIFIWTMVWTCLKFVLPVSREFTSINFLRSSRWHPSSLLFWVHLRFYSSRKCINTSSEIKCLPHIVKKKRWNLIYAIIICRSTNKTGFDMVYLWILLVYKLFR